jgi:transposase
MNQEPKIFERVIGLDAHPDTFTSAFVRGPTPAAAVQEKTFDRVPLDNLVKWAKKQTTSQDLFVLEASGNSFQIVRTLASIERTAYVLESRQMGQLKEAHANNDKLSALRIAKAYLAGTAKKVWVPDLKTQERRDIFHIHRKAVKRTGQVRARLLSYLSDNGVRWKGGALTEEKVRPLKAWTPVQWDIISSLLLEKQDAEASRKRWRSIIAREVLSDPMLLSITRLCGVRDVIAFALGAIIGDIHRFANAKKLVKYIGLNPAYDHSGQEEWNGGVRGHGRRDLRSLLMEAAHSILRSKQPVARWGKRLLARKSCRNLTVCAVARKLVVAIWYLMMGQWTPLEELDKPLETKMGKIIRELLPKSRADMAENLQALREQVYTRIKSGRVYTLDPTKTFTVQSAVAT